MESVSLSKHLWTWLYICLPSHQELRSDQFNLHGSGPEAGSGLAPSKAFWFTSCSLFINTTEINAQGLTCQLSHITEQKSACCGKTGGGGGGIFWHFLPLFYNVSKEADRKHGRRERGMTCKCSEFLTL